MIFLYTPHTYDEQTEMIFVRDIMHVLGEANYSKYTEKAERACREERLGICADRDVAKKKAYRRWQKKYVQSVQK